MKRNIFLSLLFAFITTFAAIHEVHHIYNQDTTNCVVCHFEKNLHADDVVTNLKPVEIISFEDILYMGNDFICRRDKDTLHSRAPPIFS